MDANLSSGLQVRACLQDCVELHDRAFDRRPDIVTIRSSYGLDKIVSPKRQLSQLASICP